ncbi:MAG: hypothetical protein JWM98_387 [Thermoleophilia bacterium]|nr:hypothetical protein [Thermoleophilia bacterium]
MDGSIGATLAGLVDTRALRGSAGSNSPAAAPWDAPVGGRSASSFAKLLDEGLRARAARYGVTLPGPDAPAAPGAAGGATAAPADADALWQSAKLQSSARNGQGDAIMQALSDASQARWEARGRGHDNAFDMLGMA